MRKENLITDDVKVFVNRVKQLSPKSFINHKNELILEPTNNIFFKLDNMQTEMDFKCLVLAYLSRPSCKGTTEHWQKKLLDLTNGLLETSFTKEEMRCIYSCLGNDCNRELSEQFIRSNYDLSLLETKSKEEFL